uniref:Tetraspanin 11 n=1 Tax=Crocodylus porosus TaxID=8502 RepID=A0A7M4FCV8_CROPO
MLYHFVTRKKPEEHSYLVNPYSLYQIIALIDTFINCLAIIFAGCGTFMYLLVVLFCLEASVAMLAHIYPDKMGSELKGTLGHLFHQYNGTHSHCPSNRAVDIIQKQLQCCGVYNYTDWVKAALPVSCHLQARSICVPESCCKETFHCSGDVNQSAQLFQEGCLKKLNYRLHFVMHFVFWCCAVLACLQVLAAISNGILMKHRPFQDLRILDSAVFS